MRKIEDLNTYFENLEQARTVEEVQTLFLGASRYSGFSSSGIVSAAQDFSDYTDLVDDWPQGWSSFYADQDFVRHDPVGRMTLFADRPFTWHEAEARVRGGKKSAEVMDEARAAGLSNGLTIPIRGERIGIVTFTGPDFDPKALRPEIMESLARATYRRIVDIQNGSRRDDALAAILAMPPREYDVSAYVAQGMQYQEVADRLGISRKTVEGTLQRAANRLGLQSIRDLKATLLGRLF